MRNATSPAPAMPDTHSVLEEFGALDPVVAYWNDEPLPGEQVLEGKLDEDVFDEAIFAGMVALR